MNRLLCSVFLLVLSASLCAQPHLPRTVQDNTLSNASIDGSANWTLKRPGIYEASVTRTKDGSGSFKLSHAHSEASGDYDWFVSRTYQIEQSKTYTVSAYMRANEFPAPLAGLIIIFRKADGSWLQNAPSSLKTVADSGDWQEVATQFRTPEGAVYAQIYGMLTEQRKGQVADVWLDDFSLVEGVSYANAPSPKQAYDGKHTKIDALGNIYVAKNGVHEQFVPLCIHADNLRPDWQIYSEQGFNCNMWAGSSRYIEKAKNAVSEFNPDGMMSGLQIANFMMPSIPDYNDIGLLEKRINDITNAGLQESLLWYYWDNEKEQLAEWMVPFSVTNKIREMDTGHPIYMLMDNEGLTRAYKNNTVNMIDVTGDYINVAQQRDNLGLVNVNNIQHQTAPLSIAQINYGTGLTFRARIYAALANGAKGFSIWRDDFTQAGTMAGPIENTTWWNDLPNIRREIDQLKPLIAQPHWTKWQASVASKALDVGTRDYLDKGYIIFANEHNVSIQTTVTITGLHYTAKNVLNALTQEAIASVTDNTFTVLVPAHGSLVIKLQ